jgi:5-methylcytosine-specific restriction endonuclease McrA
MEKLFPKWTPLRGSYKRFFNNEFSVRYMALKSSSYAFIRKDDVRKHILNKNNIVCAECGTKENLTIDHKFSIYAAAKNTKLISILNTKGNLQVLCKRCNSKKAPI